MTVPTAPRQFSSLLILLTAACLILATVSSVRAVEVIAGLTLTLYLPGAALVSAIDPWHHQIKGPERYLWLVGCSIGIVILGGLILNLSGGLTRSHWLVLVTGVVLIATFFSWVRGVRGDHDPVAGHDTPSSVTGSRPAGRTSNPEAASRKRDGLSLRQGALLLGALAVVAAALVISERTNAIAAREHFVQAWILPQPVRNVSSSTAQVGVRNFEGGRQVFVVRVKVGSSTASTWIVALKQGQKWTHELSRHDQETVAATVAPASKPSAILDSVDLAKPTS